VISMMNWKGFGRKRSWHNFKVLSQHSPGGTEENHEEPHSSQPADRHLKLVSPEYEAGLLTTSPRRSTNSVWYVNLLVSGERSHDAVDSALGVRYLSL
jgi:hypothetical protein